MKITKFGHCCLLIEEDGVNILTDPGSYVDLNKVIESVKDVDVVLISHEHADHIHVPSLKRILLNSPDAKVVSNEAVSRLLNADKVEHKVINGGEKIEIDGVEIEAIEGKHEEIYETFGQVQNTGFFINDKLFYPGDSFHDPKKKIDILALPVAGPWCKIGDVVRYALKVMPKKSFPVHDGMLIIKGANHSVPTKFLSENGIEFIIIEEGDNYEFE